MPSENNGQGQEIVILEKSLGLGLPAPIPPAPQAVINNIVGSVAEDNAAQTTAPRPATPTQSSSTGNNKK